jgi:diguanylate cyclase (GGDEF)-like protein
MRDELTGLYNRRFCFERLEQEVARADRYRTGLACMVADIDHFKAINDTLGHTVGDEALRAVARVLMRWTRRSDTVARVGGDEFAALLVGNTEAGSIIYADGLRQRVSAIHLPAHDAPSITLSIGIAYYPGAAVREPLQELVPAADAALLRAKRLGRNRVEVAGAVRDTQLAAQAHAGSSAPGAAS